jgi:type IV secretion system protein TrbG
MMLGKSLLATRCRSTRIGFACLTVAVAGCASAPKAAVNDVSPESETNRRETQLPDSVAAPLAASVVAGGFPQDPAFDLRPVLPGELTAATQVVPVRSLTLPPQPAPSTTGAVGIGAGSHTDANGPSGVMEFLFGHSEPVVRCTVLRVCVIELEPGEALADEPIAGDQARWIITRARNGRGGTNALVVVKPKACDIATNLVLSTDRRIYNIDLESPPCRPRDTNPKQAFTRRIRFTYPDDAAAAPVVGTTETITAVSTETVASPTIADSATLSARGNRDYGVVRHRRGPFGLLGSKPLEFPWTPAAIEDDGAHVYITLPPEAKQHAAPVLYALEDDGSRSMLNFTMQDSRIVTDRTFRRGLLVIMSGNREQTLTFENRAWRKAAGGRP